MTTATNTGYKPGRVNFTTGLWREDDRSARYAIRRTYRLERPAGRWEARIAAQIVATALVSYKSHQRWSVQ